MGCRFLDLLDRQARNRVFQDVNPCQRGAGHNNCYAAAGAMFDFLATGQRRAAVCIGPGQGLVLLPDRWTGADLSTIMRRVLRGGHGTQVLVSGVRAPGSRFSADHGFLLVNIDPPNGIRRPGRGSVHAVDPYANVLVPDRPGPTFSQSLREIRSFYVDWNEVRRFEYRDRRYDVRVVGMP